MQGGDQSPIPRPSPFELERFARAINAQQFYEAHEILEEVWIALGRPRPSFVQGLVQLAAGLEQLKRNNTFGARTLTQRGLENCSLDPSGLPGPAYRFLQEMKEYAEAGFQGPYPEIRHETSSD